MSNTSTGKPPTSQTSKKRLIIDEIGRDTKTGIIGRGYSPDNGKTFYVLDTIYGRLYGANDINAIWNNGTSDRVKKMIDSATAEIPAVESAADEAVKKADSAIASSKVNSDAIVAQSEAISEAKAAMDSVTAEIQQTASNAASDAAKIRADVAQVQNEVDTAKAANSASVEALKSDVSAAKQDLADVHDSLTKAQAAAEESQKAIDNSIAQINSDIEQDRKDIASAQQANADTAKQLDTYSKQAQDQGKTIKSIQDKQDGFTATLVDVQGNVTQVSDKVDGLSASLKDTQDNVASIKAQADQLSATLTDHAKGIATLTASAKELSSTLEDADGRLSKVEQTAQTNSSTLSDVQGDLSQVKQDATTLTATLKGAQGNISTLQQKADSVSAQLASAQGDIASLQTDVTGIKATLVSHEGDIHTLQADSKSLHDSMQDVQGNISTLQKTSTDVTSELKDHDGRMSKVEQTASTLTNEFSDQQGHLNRVEQTAQGTEQTVANQQGQINDIKTDISGVHETITGQGNQIATINTSLNGLNTKYESVSGDLGKLKDQTNWKIVTGVLDANQYTKTARIFYQDIQANNTPNVGWFYLIVDAPSTSRITQTLIKDNATDTWTRVYNGSWQAWTKGATNLDVTALSNRITTNSTQITQNKQAIALKADQSTVDNLSGEVSQNSAQLKVQAGQISSKVSSTDFKTLNDKVNGMQIGTRNLLHNTSDQYRTLTGEGWMGVYTSSDSMTSVTQYHAGDQFTYAATISNTSDVPVELQVWQCDQNKNRLTDKAFGMSAYIQPGESNVQAFANIQLDSGTHYLQTCIYSSGGQSGTHTIQVKDERLVEGNVAGTWEANPDDLITSITKNATAIDQTNSKISLKADQTEVDQIKNTATQNSSRLDVMAGQISSKVTATDVNNIVDKKGYATTSTVQSLITQKAGTINENITNLDAKYSAKDGINLQRGTGDCSFPIDSYNATVTIENYDDRTKMFHVKGSCGFYTSYNADTSFVPTVGEIYTVSADVKGVGTTSGDFFKYEGADSCSLGTVTLTNNWQRISNTVHIGSVSGQWIFYLNHNAGDFYVKHIKIERGSVATPWTPAPSDNATVTQVQQITASIDGLQSTVANKADKSQITQLSNVIQSKVSSSDFNDLKDKTTWKSADSIDLNTAVSQQKIFVKGGSNLPPGGYWWYVRVEPGYVSRIAQYATSDRDNKQYHRQYDGVNWSAWTQDASESEITQLRDDINLRVKSGDLISQINLEAGQTLIQSQKILLDGETVVFGEKEKAFIPSAMITNLNADKINAGTLSGVNLSINNDNDLTLINNDGVTNAGLVPNTTNRFITTRVNDGVITFGNTSLDNDKTSGNILVDPEGLTSQWEGKATIDKSNLYDSKYAVAQLDNQGTDLSQEIQDKLANKNGTVYKLSFFAKADNDQDKLLIDFNDAQGSQVLTMSYQQYVFNLSNKDDVDTARVIFSGIKDNKGTVYVTEPVLTRDLTPAELAVKAISGIGKTYDSSIFGNDGNLLESSKGTITIHAGDLLNDKSFWTSDGTWISKSIPPAEIKLNPNKNGSGAVTIQASGSVIDMNASSVSIFSALGDPAKGQGVQIEGLGIGGNTIWSEDDFFSIGSKRTGTYTYINAKGINYKSTLSSKTRIKRLDRKEALSTIMRDDIYTYLYKSDVQLGLTKRHASLVIDDENDVAQYRAPEEFISENGNARDDGTQLGYLIAAVQYQQEQIEELKKKLEEK